jgi:hypothetical protein
MIRRFYLSCILLSTAAFAHAQQAGDTCLSQARTELERTYCNIAAAAPGAALPSLQELRRNPEKTQRLLLRRPAEQAGIKLPPESGARAVPKPAPKEPAASTVPAQPPMSTPPSPASVSLNSGGSLGHCQLLGTSIRCGAEQFRLQGNLPNSRLAKGALEPGQRVGFVEFSGSTADNAQVMTYLSETYQHYIEAMLDIGLGASTMSFTKFHHTFMEAENKGTRFGERLSTMFEFLKKDKASMGVQTHYNDALPENMEQCMGLGANLLVCDNVQQNWIYKKTTL